MGTETPDLGALLGGEIRGGGLTMQTKCKYWKDQPDGYHGYCLHPEGYPGDTCILDIEDTCLLFEEVLKS